MGLAAMSGVSVIVPNRNRRELLEALLAKLAAGTGPIVEIVVVDDASEDGSAEAARKLGARVVRLGARGGFSRAVNRGLRECRTDLIAIVNNDVEPAPDWLEKLVAALAGPGERLWFAAGKLLSSGGEGILDGAFDMLSRGGCAWRAGHGRADGGVWDQPRQIRFAPFTAALFRAALFERVGGLDERFDSYLEDVDFGLRCAMAGLQGVYVPAARAWHAGSATLGRWSAETVHLIARNQLLLVAKHYPRGWVKKYGWPVLVGQGLWALVALRHGAPCAWLRGKREGVRLWRSVRTEARQRPALERILRESEAEILELQRRTGFDPYWRLYFALT